MTRSIKVLATNHSIQVLICNQEQGSGKPSIEVRDPEDPETTRPLPRYNAMLAVLKNTLYMYGFYDDVLCIGLTIN
jgi:hypothetical protein